MSLRLFAALSIPGDIAERLTALMRGVPGAKWRPRENLHLTLRFFGDVTEPVADEIDSELAQIAVAPFELQLKGAGKFGGADPHALYVGAGESAPLTKLAAACERAARRAGLKAESHKFTPHVTMAYLNNADLSRVHAFETRLGLFQTPPFRVESFALYSSWTKKSAPSLYRLEAEYFLRG
ncbi:MAG TPA: RNA 2',3'-cyclic phosphodiesterase [Terricaulis sp.]|nr:RNA 2',3'-cyclic phosphodiesterase [Terricaulis sp.]HRP09869.1 RNA 2',3'-cyclic phosphodiesterase [Terricaulis sp.]